MTLHHWETERDPFVLLDYLFPMRGMDSTEEQPRPSRLYLLACGRQSWDQLPRVGRALLEVADRVLTRSPPEQSFRRAAMELAEEMTHRRGDAEEIAELERRARSIGLTLPPGEPDAAFDPETWGSLAHLVYFPFAPLTPTYRRIAKGFHSTTFLREVFGAAPKPAYFQPCWRDRNVLSIAQNLDDGRDFSSLPLLADALQDAGCTDPYILEHCRQPRGHIRGCWVIESLLHQRGKK
ncbi:MAG TPA: hypothetical protein VGI99_06625 [Gemmataceae bacterium]